jgi:GrpB-like predicted nucleotidyltransferase (UPF0157 family)
VPRSEIGQGEQYVETIGTEAWNQRIERRLGEPQLQVQHIGGGGQQVRREAGDIAVIVDELDGRDVGIDAGRERPAIAVKLRHHRRERGVCLDSREFRCVFRSRGLSEEERRDEACPRGDDCSGPRDPAEQRMMTHACQTSMMKHGGTCWQAD